MKKHNERITFIMKGELLIRKTLYFFFTYYALYCLTNYVRPEVLTYEFASIPVYIPIFFIVSIPLTIFVRNTIVRSFRESDLYKEIKSEEYESLLPILKHIVTITFYFLVQCGIIAVFVPELGLATINGVPILLAISIANCFLVFLFYNKYIFSK
ncbi:MULTISPECIES: hypothetical protein [Bacillus cereus group]|uniref:hypothetical protein n=1 Tax=Bacillus cereus group TaxID=86661 RepID=UPI0022E85F3D|nr:hypothetical protein [Bacillus cereus group sp. TH152-1LC]MDA1675429.1 hypothetical protein [Bacillus cereus group sp. TH152-1LC]